MTIRLICLDADDTLWHNMRYFNAAETALYDMLAPFAAADVSHAALQSAEERNLATYGYGAKGFTLSMIETAAELVGDRLTADMIRDLLAAGRSLLSHPVELLGGVADALDALATRGDLVLVTKGDLLHQEAKLAASGLGDRFAAIEIVSDKTEDTFRRVIARHGVRADQTIVAGDSLRSDILPALRAGAWAAYIPQPGAWNHEQAETPTDNEKFVTLPELGALPEIIDRIDAGKGSHQLRSYSAHRGKYQRAAAVLHASASVRMRSPFPIPNIVAPTFEKSPHHRTSVTRVRP